MNNYTSLELSKKLKDFKGESSNSYYSVPLDNEEKRRFIFGNEQRIGYVKHEIREGNEFYQDLIPAYDILNDLCVKYAKELFGEDNYKDGGLLYPSQYYSKKVLSLLQQGKKEEAESYLYDNCLFNPKNK